MLNLRPRLRSEWPKFDADSDLGALAITAPVPPGGVVTAKWAFNYVADPNVVTVSVHPGFTYQAAFWKTG